MASVSQSTGRNIGATFTGVAGVAETEGLAAAFESFDCFDFGFSMVQLRFVKFLFDVKRMLDGKTCSFSSRVTVPDDRVRHRFVKEEARLGTESFPFAISMYGHLALRICIKKQARLEKMDLVI
jgi:hypothetical protein